jgi:biopolymer transport protein ExbD
VIRNRRTTSRSDAAGGDETVHFRPPGGRFRTRKRETAIQINIAPMIDMTFLLLTFFLVTTTFERAEGILASRLPTDRGQAGTPLPISPIKVRLSSLGPDEETCVIRIENVTEVPTDFEDLARLLLRIQSHPGFDDETPVIILADADVRWDHVVSAWNAAMRCAYKKIAFGGG